MGRTMLSTNYINHIVDADYGVKITSHDSSTSLLTVLKNMTSQDDVNGETSWTSSSAGARPINHDVVHL